MAECDTQYAPVVGFLYAQYWSPPKTLCRTCVVHSNLVRLSRPSRTQAKPGPQPFGRLEVGRGKSRGSAAFLGRHFFLSKNISGRPEKPASTTVRRAPRKNVCADPSCTYGEFHNEAVKTPRSRYWLWWRTPAHVPSGLICVTLRPG